MIVNAQKKKNHLHKLNFRAHINYLVDYNLTNIYRVWILHQEKMISMRDIIFDKSQIFDECMKDLLASLLKNLNTLVQNIKLSDS